MRASTVLKRSRVAVIAFAAFVPAIVLAQGPKPAAGSSRGVTIGSGAIPPVTVYRRQPPEPSVRTQPPGKHSHYVPSFGRWTPVAKTRGLKNYGGVPDLLGDSSSVDSSPAAADSSIVTPQPDGTLRLEVDPATAQIYVDGEFVGTVEEFNSTGGALLAGRHDLEIRSPGYDTLRVPVNILPGTMATYRQQLSAAAAPVNRPAAPAAPDTFYVIAGCYAGNRPPDDVVLPKGCDAQRVRRFSTTPQVR